MRTIFFFRELYCMVRVFMICLVFVLFTLVCMPGLHTPHSWTPAQHFVICPLKWVDGLVVNVRSFVLQVSSSPWTFSYWRHYSSLLCLIMAWAESTDFVGEWPLAIKYSIICDWSVGASSESIPLSPSVCMPTPEDRWFSINLWGRQTNSNLSYFLLYGVLGVSQLLIWSPGLGMETKNR